MKRSYVIHLSAFGCKAGTALLACAFLSGFLAGFPVSAGSRAVFVADLLAPAYSAGISAWIPPLLPLLFSAFAIYAKRPVLLIPIAFWKALLFSSTAFGAVCAWGSAGWILSSLMMFSSFCSLPVLWWYWLRHIDGRNFEGRTFFPALGAALLIGWVDLTIISPFLTNILIY